MWCPVGSLLLSPRSWGMQDFVCVLQEWRFCSPRSCGSPTVKSCWPTKSDPLGIPDLSLSLSLSLSLLDPQAEKPDMELRTFTRVGVLLCYTCSPVCWLPTHWVWDWILSWLRPSSHPVVASPLSLDVEYLFWWVQTSMVLQQLVVISLLSQEEASAHTSSLPSWTNLLWQCFSMTSL